MTQLGVTEDPDRLTGLNQSHEALGSTIPDAAREGGLSNTCPLPQSPLQAPDLKTALPSLLLPVLCIPSIFIADHFV